MQTRNTTTGRGGASTRSGITARSRLKAPTLVLAGAFCLSLSAVLVKIADVNAATTAVARCAIALVVLVPLALRERTRCGSLSRSGYLWSFIAGIALGLDYAAWTASIYSVGAGVSTVLINVQVVVLPTLAFLIDKEKPTRGFLVSLPLMILGISLVGGLWDAQRDSADSLFGVLLGVLAGCGYAIYLFVTRRATRQEPGLFVQPLMCATASATAVTLALSPLSGGIRFTGISLYSWTWLVLLAVVGQVAAWLFIHHGSADLSSSTTAALLLLQPVLALVLSAVVLGEIPTVLQLLGAALVICSVAVANGLILRQRWSGERLEL